MKHIRNGFVYLLIAALIFCYLPVPTFAKDMEECYHCNKTGEFHCPTCGNQGVVLCDGCGGAGTWVCPGEEGKGPCDHGYYICPSCNGDGFARPIPADGATSPCGQCNGTGKLECWHCHGAGGGVCDRCGGSGWAECQNGNCKIARTIGYKCPECKGTGFLGGQNDGVHNVPQVGDHIITDSKTYTGYYYGTGETDPAPGSNPGRDPYTGRDYIWFVDLGPASWDINGTTITVSRNGAPVTGVVDLKLGDPIRLEGLAGMRDVHVYLTDENGVKVELQPNGDGEVTVGNQVGELYVPTFHPSLSIEYTPSGDEPGPDEPGPGPDVPGPDNPNPGPDETGPGPDPSEPDPGIDDPYPGPDEPNPPQDRTWFVDFGKGSWTVEDSDKTATAWIGGKQATGEIELNASDVIQLKDIDREKMVVRVRADDGFCVTLILNGDDEVSLGRYEEVDFVIGPDHIHFVVEERHDEDIDDPQGGGDPNEGNDPQGGENTPISADPDAEPKNADTPVAVPEDRKSDFDIMPAVAENTSARSAAKVETARMNKEEQTYYEALTEEKLTDIVENVKKIVETAQPGKIEGETDKVLEQIAKDNGFASKEDGKIFPINFEGHQDIGFPVKVTVVLNKGDLDGGSALYAYHQMENGQIEALGEAEYDTYEDGSVRTLSFYTTGFSTFFTASKQLDLSKITANAAPKAESTHDNFPVILVIVIAACVLVIAVVVIIVLAKKKKGAKA